MKFVIISNYSGVYVHYDGLCTPMGDVSEEIKEWTLL
jgi:hypothetical protein